MEKALIIMGIISALAGMGILITLMIRKNSMAKMIIQFVFFAIMFLLQIPELVMKVLLGESFVGNIVLMILFAVSGNIVTYLMGKYNGANSSIIYLEFREK